MSGRLRVLLSAYYCSPYRGSESSVGWQTAIGLAKHHDVTVICGDLSSAAPTGKELEKYRTENGLPAGLEIVHVQAEGAARMIHDLHGLPGFWFLYYAAYRRWQRQILEVAKRIHQGRPFDVVHHVNIIGFREPGYLWQLGIPFFWGPVSGAPLIPPAFIRDFSKREQLRWGSRNVINRWQIRHARRSAAAARAASKVWAVSEEDQRMFARWGVVSDLMLEAGSSEEGSGSVGRQLGDGEVLRVCWSGLFQGIKALPVLLRAVSEIGRGKVFLEVLGDGPEAGRWKALAIELGLGTGQICWHGMLKREAALDVMDHCHILAHTSIKEATATVVLEALERGLPVICHDACGMGVAIDDRCGFRVKLQDPATSVSGFRDAILRILEDRSLCGRLSRGALLRAGELSWQGKIGRFEAAYEQVVAG